MYEEMRGKKNMKKLALLPAILFIGSLATTAAKADPILCTDSSLTSLQSYLALGATGCQLNSLLFANFNYSDTLTGTGRGTQQAASAVSVTILPGIDWQFSASWNVTGTQQATVTLGFTVSQFGNNISHLTNSFTGLATGGGTVTPSAICTGGAGTPCQPPVDFTNASLSITPTPGPLTITNQALENANGTGVVHLSVITDQFAPTPPPGVPEPVTTAMAGVGVVLLIVYRRRRREI